MEIDVGGGDGVFVVPETDLLELLKQGDADWNMYTSSVVSSVAGAWEY